MCLHPTEWIGTVDRALAMDPNVVIPGHGFMDPPNVLREELEAYTPAPKRVRGYYAMPMLWGTEFVGWANVGVPRQSREAARAGARALDVDVGFVDKRPRDREFGRELDAEIARLAEFLQPTRA